MFSICFDMSNECMMTIIVSAHIESLIIIYLMFIFNKGERKKFVFNIQHLELYDEAYPTNYYSFKRLTNIHIIRNNDIKDRSHIVV